MQRPTKTARSTNSSPFKFVRTIVRRRFDLIYTSKPAKIFSAPDRTDRGAGRGQENSLSASQRLKNSVKREGLHIVLNLSASEMVSKMLKH